MELRISSGKYRNTKLKVGPDTRPVKETVKLAIFSKIGDFIEDAKCLDLYAGSGNLGFEAMSRGAQSVDMIEISPLSIKIIDDNLQKLKQNFKEDQNNENINIIKKDSLDYVANEYAHYDIVFADPPYNTQTNHLIKNIDNMMKKGSIFIFLHENEKKYDLGILNPNLKLIDSRRYGITTVDFIELV